MADQIIRLTRKNDDGLTVILYPLTSTEQVVDLDTGLQSLVADNTDGDSGVYIPIPDDYFYRPSLFTTTKTTVALPKGLAYMLNDKYFQLTSSVTIDLDEWMTVANRKGNNVYIYAVEPGGTSVTPTFVLSSNSTYPSGYTAQTSRKLGGFHCLCVSVGSITGHALDGYEAGDILPASRWDLWHRAQSGNEGMVFCEQINKWVDIYINSVSGSNLVSVYGGTIADGASSEKFHWYKFAYRVYRSLGKTMPTVAEFQEFAIGSNNSTAMSSDPGTAGGHTDSTGRRMISNIGVEDCCGAMYQSSCERCGAYGASSWADAFDANSDAEMKGQHYMPPGRILLGGMYTVTSSGIRLIDYNAPLNAHPNIAVRSLSDHIHKIR